MAVSLAVIHGGPHGKDVKAGPIFDENGEMFLLALRDVQLGDPLAADAFVYPDFSRPEVGKTGKAGDFWWGFVPFSQ